MEQFLKKQQQKHRGPMVMTSTLIQTRQKEALEVLANKLSGLKNQKITQIDLVREGINLILEKFGETAEITPEEIEQIREELFLTTLKTPPLLTQEGGVGVLPGSPPRLGLKKMERR